MVGGRESTSVVCKGNGEDGDRACAHSLAGETQRQEMQARERPA